MSEAGFDLAPRIAGAGLGVLPERHAFGLGFFDGCRAADEGKSAFGQRNKQLGEVLRDGGQILFLERGVHDLVRQDADEVQAGVQGILGPT